MRQIRAIVILIVFLGSVSAYAQDAEKRKIVIVTGVRFAYPLVQKWIEDFNQLNPDIQVVIEARGSADPKNYDVLVEAYEHDEEIRNTRDYAYVARYAILPVANRNSEFAKIYGEKGLNVQIIKQLFFDDLFADPEDAEKIVAPATVYTRLQKAGAPAVFAGTYGLKQNDIRGKAIAGSDEHLLKAILRDSTGLSYLPLTLIYDHKTRKPVDGLTVLPLDINANGKVADDEKIVTDLDQVLQKVETTTEKERKGLAVGYLHLSVPREGANPYAIDFIRYVVENGNNQLREFGYIMPEESRTDKSRFKALATIRK